MNLLQSMRRTRTAEPDFTAQQRALYEMITGFTFNGTPLIPVQTTLRGSKVEEPGNDFCSYCEQIYKRDGIIWSAIEARALLLSETTFKFRNLGDKKMFGGPELLVLEKPRENQTTGEFLKRLEQDSSLAGNFYAYRDGDQVIRLDPGRVSIVLASDSQPDDPQFAYDARVLGYFYRGNSFNNQVTKTFLPDEIVHYSPTPDPNANFRGMSWITPIIREAVADMAVNDHKKAFFENAATPNLIVKFPEAIATPEQANPLIDVFLADHAGAENAFKTLFLAAGADATVVGASGMIDFKNFQGAYETRIGMAARVPASVLQSSEGLQGSSLNAGNFSSSRRQFTDGWYHPTVKAVCGALEPLVQVPAGAQLWYDTSDIAFLREDEKDAADIRQKDSLTIKALTDSGYTPDSVVAAVKTGDFTQLKHTGLYSVQLQPPGTGQMQQEPPTPPSTPPKPGVPPNGPK